MPTTESSTRARHITRRRRAASLRLERRTTCASKFASGACAVGRRPAPGVARGDSPRQFHRAAGTRLQSSILARTVHRARWRSRDLDDAGPQPNLHFRASGCILCRFALEAAKQIITRQLFYLDRIVLKSFFDCQRGSIYVLHELLRQFVFEKRVQINNMHVWRRTCKCSRSA